MKRARPWGKAQWRALASAMTLRKGKGNRQFDHDLQRFFSHNLKPPAMAARAIAAGGRVDRVAHTPDDLK